jgi:hypothetical protein
MNWRRNVIISLLRPLKSLVNRDLSSQYSIGIVFTNIWICDKVYQRLATGRWFSPSTLFSSTNKTDRHEITEILLIVALNTITLTPWKFTLVNNFTFFNKIRFNIKFEIFKQFCHDKDIKFRCFGKYIIQSKQFLSFRKKISQTTKLLICYIISSFGEMLYKKPT